MNKWKQVWTKNKVEDYIKLTGNESPEEIFVELKNFTGPNYHGGSFSQSTYDLFTAQFEVNLRELSFSTDPDFKPRTFFDVGCATGPYLYYLVTKHPGCRVGGVDLSESYVNTARRFIPDAIELYAANAAEINAEIKYDCVYSRSIFQYFNDLEYGREVTRRMIEKSDHSVGILDVHDLAKRDEFLAYRRFVVEDYDEKYKDTQHLFYPKDMFIDMAEQMDCDVKFAHCFIHGYWNAPFTYDVYFYKRKGSI